MQVGVKDAVVQGLGQEGADQVVGQDLAVQAGLLESGRLRQRQAFGPGQGQHPLADTVPDHLGRMHVAVAGHDLGQFGGAGGLEPEVQFQLQRAGDGGGQGLRLQPARLGPQPAGEARGQGQGADVPEDPPLHARAQHLHGHLAPVQQVGRMGLGQGGGGHRRPEVGVEARQRPAEVALDLGAGLVGGEGRQPVAKPAEVLGEITAEDVRTGGHHLSELDRHRSQVLERAGHALAGPSGPGLPAGEQPREPAQHPRPRRQQRLQLARDQGVVARQDPAGAHQAGEGAEITHAQIFRWPIRGAAPPPRR